MRHQVPPRLNHLLYSTPFPRKSLPKSGKIFGIVSVRPVGYNKRVGEKNLKVLLQRVTSATVSVASEEVGRIGPGLVVFVGVANGDTEKDIQYLVPKMLGLG